MTENPVTGRKYRILTNATTDTWDRISFWTKASDVEYNDSSTAEDNKPINIIKRSTAYDVGVIGYVPTAPSWVMLKCTTSGTTLATLPSTYQTITEVGRVITDGTAKFTVYDVRPQTTLSSGSPYQIPAMNTVSDLSDELIATNGNNEKVGFYFDYQNGHYGYNTSPTRESSTFTSFSFAGGDMLPTSLKATAHLNSTSTTGNYGKSEMTLTAKTAGSVTKTTSEGTIKNNTTGEIIENASSSLMFEQDQTLTFTVQANPSSSQTKTATLSWTWSFS